MRFVRQRTEVVVLVVLLLVSVALRLFDESLGPGIYFLGLTTGAGLALQAVGIVVVYRANRIINFAQVEMGLLGGALFLELVRTRLPLLAVRKACPACLPGPETLGDLARIDNPGFQAIAEDPALVGFRNVQISQIPGFEDFLPDRVGLDDLALQMAPDWLVHVNYWLSMLIAFAVAVFVSWAAYALIIRRFDRAPRLIATVMTIGLAEVFEQIRNWLVSQISGTSTQTGAVDVFGTSAAFPFNWHFEIDTVIFDTTDIVSILAAAVVLVGLTLFFTRNAIGVMLRGASENPDRAETLGVNIASVNGVVWIIAGGLSAIASILMVTATSIGGAANLIGYLTAAVMAGFVSIPMAVISSLGLGILTETFIWVFDDAAIVDGIMLAVIVVSLLFQRSRRERVDTDDASWKAAREMRPIPRELRHVDVVERWVTSAKVIGTVVILGMPWLLSPSQTNRAAVTLIYGMIGLSLLVLTGWAGQISLGQFAFAGVGAWFTASFQWPFPLSIIFGGILGAIVAVMLGLPSLRLRGLHLAVTTLAFSVVTSAILLSPRHLGSTLPTSLPRPAIVGLDLDDQRTFYYFTLVFLGLCFVSVVGMRRSRIARALIACRENEPGAQTAGINVLRARLTAFAVSGFMAAFAGGMFAYSQHGVNISSFGVDQSFKMFLMVVIGGLGSVAGPLLGAAYVGITEIAGQSVFLFSVISTGVGAVIVMLFVPGGLAEFVYGIRDLMLRRVADRYRIEVPSLVADRRLGEDRQAPIAAKTRPGGGTIFVPTRYEPDGQWAVDAREKEEARG